MTATKARNGKIHYAWIIMIACCFLQAGQLGIIQNLSGVFLQPVSDSIGCGRGDLSLYMTIQAWSTAAVMPLVGRWLPTKNINVLMTVAAVLDGGGFMLMGTFTQPWMWWIDAVIIGVSSAFLFFAPLPMIITNWFKKKTGLAMGIATAFSGVGAAIFTPILANLIVSVGWQSSYYIAGAASLVLTVPFTAFVLKFKPADVGLTPYGASAEETVAQAKADMATGMSVKRAWATGLVVLIFLIGGIMSLTTSFTQHMTGFGKWVGFSATTLGLLGSANMIGNLVGKLVLGPLNDKIGTRKTLTIGYIVVFIGLIITIFNGGNTALLFAGATMYGVAFSIQTVMLPLVCQTMFGPKDYPKLFSYATMGNALIGSVGISINGALFDATASYYPGLTFVAICGVVAMGMCFIGMVRARKVGFDKNDDTPEIENAATPSKLEEAV